MPRRHPYEHRRWLRALVLLAPLLGACEAEVRVTEATFELHSATGCELGNALELELTALGDFAARTERFELETATSTFERFPLATRELVLRGTFSSAPLATGRAALDPERAAPRSMIVLPEGRSCPLSDRGIAAGEGAMVAPLPGGGLLIAGGTSTEGKVLSSAVLVAPGELIGEVVPDGMLVRRQYASATVAGSWVVVAGGAEGARGGAEETYEVYDTVRGTFARELSRHLESPRMEHGAARLPDGDILLVGGRAEPDGEPLATAELIRFQAASPDQPGDLVDPRVAPSVLVLDSGAVVVAGGRDAAGAVVASLERFEAAAKRFVRLDVDLPRYEHTVAVALPGARVAWLGCNTSTASCGLSLVLLRSAEPVQVDVELDWSSAAPLGLSTLRAVALDDGRVLVTGRDPDANMMSRALVVDIDQRSVEPAEASRAPSVLAELEDGAIAELDLFGASLRRLGSFSVFDSPQGDLLSAGERRVVLDAPDRWNRSDEGLRALVSGARVDVPHLRFGDFRCEVRFEGAALVRIATSDQPELAIGLGPEVSAPGCAPLRAAGRVVLERRAGAVTLRTGSSESRVGCSIPWPSSSPARLAIETEADTVLRSLEITRL